MARIDVQACGTVRLDLASGRPTRAPSSFHKISIEHLHRYLSEFELRFNERRNLERFENMVSMTAQTSPLTYRALVDGADPVPF